MQTLDSYENSRKQAIVGVLGWFLYESMFTPTKAVVLILMGLLSATLGWWSFQQTQENSTSVTGCGRKHRQGLYNFTVVTALFDIGRGQWKNFNRPYRHYLQHMEKPLGLDVNLFLFADREARAVAERLRRGKEEHTHVVELRLQDLPHYRHKTRVQEIMRSVEHRVGNYQYLKRTPEATVAEYDILMWSKLYFVHRASQEDPFSNSLFVWMDAGYGNGEIEFPPDGVWLLRRPFDHPNKVTFVQLHPIEPYRNLLSRLHKMNVEPAIAGGFFAGSKEAVGQLYALQEEILEEWLSQGVVDDDQSVLTVGYFRRPELFHLVPGGWWDVFNLFHEHQFYDGTCPNARNDDSLLHE